MKAMQVMSALSQPTRLDVFTRLVSALPDGMAAGDLAAASNAAPSVMSAHLAILSRAGLVGSTNRAQHRLPGNDRAGHGTAGLP